MKQHHLHQIIEQSQNREQNLHRRKVLVNYHQFHQCLQEKKHLEVKIILNLHTSLKENKVDHQIHNQLLIQAHHLLKQNTKQENPKHDTEWDNSKSKAHWNKKPKTYVTDQLYKRGWKWPRLPNIGI